MVLRAFQHDGAIGGRSGVSDSGTTPPPAGSSAHLGVGKEIWGSRMGMRRCLARAAGSIAGLGRDEVRGRGGRDLDGEVVEAVRADSLDEGADGAGGQG